jgi:FkbM family methyltransferase
MRITKENIAIIDKDTHISKWVEESGRLDHDQNMLPLVLKHINEGDTVLDCGAFIGDHTLAYYNKALCGKVYAFECNPEAFNCLEYNTANKEGILIYKYAISDKAGMVDVSPAENAGSCWIKEGTMIKTIRIDDLKLEKCDFIKLDIEGYEYKALLGAEKTIKKFHPKLLIEINRGALERNHTNQRQVFDFLERYGYKFTNIYPGQLMEGEQYDIVCI